MAKQIRGKEQTKLKVRKYCSEPFCSKRLKPNEQDICIDCRRKAQLRMRGY